MLDKSDMLNSDKSKESPSLEESHATRRKLIKSSPFLLLLANRPSFATGTCSISGFMSVQLGTSLTTYNGDLCNGWSPGNWKKNRGQITHNAWDQAGVSPATSFSTLFNSSTLNASGGIREVVNGTLGNYVSYTSGISYSMQQVLEGAVSGSNDASSIVKHAAATFLNAAFLANGGGGTRPDPWMLNYISITDVVGLYLMYEMTFLASPAPANGVTYAVERNGAIIAESKIMTTSDYKSFFESMSDGSGSRTWQKG